MGTFIDRAPDGRVKGMYFCRQYEGQEEVENGHPDLLAFQHQPDSSLLKRQQVEADIDACTSLADVKAVLKKLFR